MGMLSWQRFLEEYGCRHPNHERRKKPYQRQGKTFYVMVSQCTTCGDYARVETTSRDFSQLPLYDREAIAQYQQGLSQGYRALQEECRAHDTAAWWDWYNTYLTSSGWRAKRAKVFDRAEGLCEGCRRHRATQVHHLTYAHVGHELLFELVAICDTCHERIHGEDNETEDHQEENNGKVILRAW